MDNQKPKEPLLAAMLSLIITGLGQIYTGQIKRGILFFIIPLVPVVSLILYLKNPPTADFILFSFAALVIGCFIYRIFTAVDAYRSAKEYNIDNNLNRTVPGGKKTWLIIGIIFFGLIINLNPSDIVIANIALYIRENVAQAFNIPTEAMMPALLKGDLILVDKVIYKKEEPLRGDVIIFIHPEVTKKLLVKRLVGLPGETLEIKNGKIYINGQSLANPPFGNFHYYSRGEYAQEGKSVTIPKDAYFVLGDHSASSQDSRYFGFVPKSYLVGKAYRIYYPFKRSGLIE